MTHWTRFPPASGGHSKFGLPQIKRARRRCSRSLPVSVESFNRDGVRFVALKGFTLTPAFCPAPHLRHQTDFDFLVAPDSF